MKEQYSCCISPFFRFLYDEQAVYKFSPAKKRFYGVYTSSNYPKFTQLTGEVPRTSREYYL